MWYVVAFLVGMISGWFIDLEFLQSEKFPLFPRKLSPFEQNLCVSYSKDQAANQEYRMRNYRMPLYPLNTDVCIDGWLWGL